MASGQLKVVLQLCVCVWGQGEGGVPHSGYDKHFVIYVYDSSLPPSNGMSRLLAAAADCFIVPPPPTDTHGQQEACVSEPMRRGRG